MLATNDQRPTDPITAQDAARLMVEVGSLKDAILEKIEGMNGRVDAIAEEVKTIKAHVNNVSTDLALSRDTRTTNEIHELIKRRALIEQELGIIDEKLEGKKNEKSLSESQKLRAIAVTSWEERERLEKENRWKWWRETLQIAGRQFIVITIVGVGSGILAVLVWFFIFYLNNR